MTEHEASTVLRRFAGDVRKHYGERFRGIYLVNAQDLYDDEDAADIETVIVLADGEWRSIDERMALVDMTYDILLDTELYIRALPVSLSDWLSPAAADDPRMRNSVPIGGERLSNKIMKKQLKSATPQR